MPDALTTLLNLDSPQNFNKYGDAYTPRPVSGYARRQSLSRFLGIPESDENGGFTSVDDLESAAAQMRQQQAEDLMRKAQAESLPERVRGEYGLEGERIKGQTTLEAARLQAERAVQEHEAAREFNAAQAALRESGMNERGRATQEAITGRSAETAANTAARQRAGQAESRARLYETEDKTGNFKVNAPRPANEGFLSRYLFGPSQRDLNRAEAARIRGEALNGLVSAPGGNSSVDPTVASYSSVPDEALESVIMSQNPDATPDEVSSFAAQVRAARGR